MNLQNINPLDRRHHEFLHWLVYERLQPIGAHSNTIREKLKLIMGKGWYDTDEQKFLNSIRTYWSDDYKKYKHR